jgi:atrial natriuretic peptide receptor A
LYFIYFTGLAGQVNIDTNGDRIADYSLLDMDPSTHTFHVSVAAHTV